MVWVMFLQQASPQVECAVVQTEQPPAAGLNRRDILDDSQALQIFDDLLDHANVELREGAHDAFHDIHLAVLRLPVAVCIRVELEVKELQLAVEHGAQNFFCQLAWTFLAA